MCRNSGYAVWHVQGFLRTRLKKCKNRINRLTYNGFLLSASIALSAVDQCFLSRSNQKSIVVRSRSMEGQGGC